MTGLVAHKIATILLERRGFGFYSDPMEGGQDAYDITQDALNEADAIIEAFPSIAERPTHGVAQQPGRSPSGGVAEALKRRIELARSFIAKEFADPSQEPKGDWISPEARPAHDALCLCLEALSSVRVDAWRPISSAPKDGTPVLVRLKNPLPEPNRTDLDRWHGVMFVARHNGLARDGFDIGWQFAAPVGQGGFPDRWIDGWQLLPAPPMPEDLSDGHLNAEGK